MFHEGSFPSSLSFSFVPRRDREKSDARQDRTNAREKKYFKVAHLSAASTRWRTCSTPATEEASSLGEAAANAEEAREIPSTSERQLPGTSPFCNKVRALGLEIE